MKLTVLIPAHNEEKCIAPTISEIYKTLNDNNISHEILVVNDNSTDGTEGVLDGLSKKVTTLRYINSKTIPGYGMAARQGLENMKGDAVCPMMADGSDSPDDLVRYYNKLQEGYDCVFGSRFIRGGRVINYPIHKLILNRFGNYFIKFFLGIKHNDITNAFKCYRRQVIEGVQPLFSNHFNLTVELPLKAIVRGYTYATIPIRWVTRTEGISKFKINEMGTRYLFIIFYIFLEKHLSQGDYLRK